MAKQRNAEMAALQAQVRAMQAQLGSLASKTQNDSHRAAEQVSQAKLLAAELEEQLAGTRAEVGGAWCLVAHAQLLGLDVPSLTTAVA
jgi:hypothetical protein